MGVPAAVVGQTGTPRGLLQLLQFGLNYAVVTVMSPVHDIDLPVVRIEEHKEIVTQQFHLLDGLCLVHRKHGKPLVSDRGRKFEFSFLFIQNVERVSNRCGFSRRFLVSCGVGLPPAPRDENLLIPQSTDLARHAIHRLINGNVWIVILLLSAEDGLPGLNRELRDGNLAAAAWLLGTQLERGINYRFMDALKLLNAGVNILPQAISQLHVACVDLDVHEGLPSA